MDGTRAAAANKRDKPRRNAMQIDFVVLLGRFAMRLPVGEDVFEKFPFAFAGNKWRSDRGETRESLICMHQQHSKVGYTDD